MTVTAPGRPGRAVNIVLIVIGAISIVVTLGGGVLRGFAAHGATDETWTADAEGLSALRISSAGADFEVQFDDVDEATLAASSQGGPVQRWRLQRSGGTLLVDTGWRWDWIDLGPLFDDRIGEEHVTLTLPAELERSGLDLDVDLSAGSLSADADWRRAVVDLSAGRVELAGSAEVLEASISAGEARLDIASPRSVLLEVSAGRIIGAVTGEQPESIDATANAGSIDITIPDGEYDVTEDVSAGRADILVTDDRAAASTISVRVSAGSVTLRADSR